MKLQLALDGLGLSESLILLDKVKDSIDIIEIGTSFIIREGLRAVSEIKRCFPHFEILADLKIMDDGYFKAGKAYRAGADYVTVLGVTDPLTIKGCLDIAGQLGKKVVANLMCVNDLPTRITELENMGVHVLSVHTGVDQQAVGREPIEDLQLLVAHMKRAEIAVAGGINSRRVWKYIDLRPEIIIVGAGLIHHPAPADEAAAIKQQMREAR
ncbi:3-hexulose-6-phosphate synthase [Klebsiella pneumoniae]|uniref:3-hexulose-6-phosphate synthase n=1 Tax=Klebsiella pneumoniae TaxID=573 RepID=UPI003EB90E5C